MGVVHDTRMQGPQPLPLSLARTELIDRVILANSSQSKLDSQFILVSVCPVVPLPQIQIHQINILCGIGSPYMR